MFHDRIQSVNFAPHTAEEIKTLSVKEITSTETYDALLHPLPDGLYDTAFGPNDRDERCDTCGLGPINCPGHFGYIELPLPVYHPMFYRLMLNILQGSCFTCHRLIPKLSKTYLFVRQSELLDKGYLTAANDLKDFYLSASSKSSGSSSATEIHFQSEICSKIDNYVEELTNGSSDSQKSSFTKNLVKTRLDLVNNFIKNDLKSKVQLCPHCNKVKRSIRQEYNTRVYFKAVSQTTLNKMMKEEKKKNQSTPSHLTEVHLTEQASQGQEYEGTDDVLENENEEEEETEGQEEPMDSDDIENCRKNRKKCGDEYITPEEIKNHMIQLWNTDKKAMKCLLGAYNGPERSNKVTTPEIFFLDVIAVPPSRFRPQSFMGEKRFENPQTSNLSKILWSCKLVKEILFRMKENGEDDFTPVVLTSEGSKRTGGGSVTVPGKTYKEQLNNAWNLLQSNVNTYMDCELNKLNLTKIPGVRQLLEKKEGLFRKHMMGKRVNFACRSVISPDLFINTDEIGVPMVFARKLTYAQPVTPWNLNQLKEMVINGPNKYPGAMMVELEDGKKQILTDDENERRAIAKKLLSSNIHSNLSNNDKIISEKKVYRHLINGDVMLLNRQPTLHRPSIMAHKVKVLPNQRTLRLHYANCKSYNADFDGDEMNAHFPQNELGRAEALNLVSTNFNYLSPKDGKPLSGLIQDHVVSGVRMTSRDAMFNREEYQQLVFNGLIDKRGRIMLLPPCILRPTPLWSGKQVFSTVLLNIIPKGKYPLNMAGNKAKVSDANWPKGKEKKGKGDRAHEVNDPFLLENQVIIRGGELMTGILDKTQYGSTAFSLVHCVYEIYGGEISGKLLSVLARLFTAYLQHTGFTLGVQAILVLPHAEKKRRELINEGRTCGNASAKEAMNLDGECDEETLYKRLKEAHYTNQGVELRQLDLAMKSRTDAINNKVNSVCMRGLLQKFPHNSLQLMVQSGAKGSPVNTMQISCLLGQIELEGRRPPLSMSGRSLPSFVPYDTSPRAGGFVDGRFLTGIRPQEYFFHCMAGREGLIDTAVKTSRSGYLQRCLIKHLEALYVQYDMTVRDGDGSVVQFLYGDDSIDVLKCQFLQKDQFKTVVDNTKSYVSILKPNEMSKVVDVKKAKKLQRKQDKWKKQHGEMYSSTYVHNKPSSFNLYEKDCRRKVEKKYPSKDKIYHRTKADLKLMERWSKADGPTRDSYLSQCQPAPDPTLSRFNPACHFGAVSEKFRQDVLDYIQQNPDNMLSNTDDNDGQSQYRKGAVNADTFEPMMLIKYMRSLVEPGEAVGLLAGQSIGEPSTQMTLNTFHFAGRGEMNVTLGIPRLREILMTASKTIKTPQMDVLITPGQEENAKSISKKLTKITLMQVLQHISVEESIEMGQQSTRVREFKIRIELLPSYTYEDMTELTAADIMAHIELLFINKISRTISRMANQKANKSLVQTSQVRASLSGQNDDEEEENQPEQAPPPDEPDDRADLSDEDAENDGDADNMKGRNRRTQFTSYDDPENREEEINENMKEDSMIDSTMINIKSELMDEDYQMVSNDIKPQIEDKKPLRAASLPQDPRIERTLRCCRNLTSYLYNPDNEWCEATMQFPLAGSKLMLVSVIEKLAEKSVVHEAPGIQRAMVSESKDPKEVGRSRLKCEGVNLQRLWKYPNVLDLDSLYCNNIHSIAESYGIEAGRRVLIKEVQDVFKVYGIQIDPRHLSLIADYMTYEGVYKPFNRIGIESNPFPFQKMSFETSTHFLKAATAFGQPDDLGSPSSRIIVGRVIGQGTGIVDLLPKLTV